MYGRFHKAVSYLPYAFIFEYVPKKKRKEKNRNSEMDQLVNVLAAKPGDLSSIPGNHRVIEKKNQLPQVIP